MLFIDVETTGRDPQRHSILSIGAIELHHAQGQFHPGKEFYEECRIWKGADVDPRALAVNGFKEHELYIPQKPSLERSVRQFIAWAKQCGDMVLAGANVGSFDAQFLQESAQRYNLPWIFGNHGYRTIELHTVCYEHMLRAGLEPPTKEGISALGSEAIFSYVGLPEEPIPHNALTGAKMEAETFSRLIYGQNLIPEYEEADLNEFLTKK